MSGILSSYRAFLALVVVFTAAGCGTVDLQKSGRTPSEQLLTTLSIEEAVAGQSIEGWVKGKRVYVECTGLNSADLEFVKKTLESRVLEFGGRLVPEREKAEVILHAMVNCSGTDTKVSRFFIPIVFPSPSDASFLRSWDLYRKEVLIGRCRMWIFALTPTGEFIQAGEPTYGDRHIRNRQLLGFTIQSKSDVPELADTLKIDWNK